MDVEVWYVAECQNCEPKLPQPFRDEKERDSWSNAHVLGTGHTVREFRERRPV